MNKAYKIQYEKKGASTEDFIVWKIEVAIVWALSEEEAIASLYHDGYTDEDEPIISKDNIQNIIVLETWDSVEPVEEAPMKPYAEECSEEVTELAICNACGILTEYVNEYYLCKQCEEMLEQDSMTISGEANEVNSH